MTVEEELLATEHMEQLLSASLDQAFGHFVVKLFDVLCVAGSTDDAAIKRFNNGMRNAITRYWQVQAELQRADVVPNV